MLGWIRLTDGKAEILLVTADGMAIRFPKTRSADGFGCCWSWWDQVGCRDIVIGMELIPRRGEILFLTSDGKAKTRGSRSIPAPGRYGQGVIAWKLPRTAQLVACSRKTINPHHHLA